MKLSLTRQEDITSVLVALHLAAEWEDTVRDSFEPCKDSDNEFAQHYRDAVIRRDRFIALRQKLNASLESQVRRRPSPPRFV